MPAFGQLGVALRNLRTRAGISQRRLEATANLSASSISRYENGETPSLPTLEAILRGLGQSLYDLAIELDAVDGSAAASPERPDDRMVQWLTWTLRERLDVAAMFAALGVHGDDPARAAAAEASFVAAARELAKTASADITKARKG